EEGKRQSLQAAAAEARKGISGFEKRWRRAAGEVAKRKKRRPASARVTRTDRANQDRDRTRRAAIRSESRGRTEIRKTFGASAEAGARDAGSERSGASGQGRSRRAGYRSYREP